MLDDIVAIVLGRSVEIQLDIMRTMAMFVADAIHTCHL